MAEWNMPCVILGQGTFEGLLGVTARNGAFMVPACVSKRIEARLDGRRFISFWKILDWTRLDEKSRKPILGYSGYFSMVNSGKELPQGTHAIVLTKIECTA
jgi:hypothetical protein